MYVCIYIYIYIRSGLMSSFPMHTQDLHQRRPPGSTRAGNLCTTQFKGSSTLKPTTPRHSSSRPPLPSLWKAVVTFAICHMPLYNAV